jgi:LysR family transcriptional activator of nhaA
MDRLNFNHLFYFYIVAKEGSIKAASDKLHVSQPTISDQIKLLEEFLHTPLFERKHRGLTLTAEGFAALKCAEQVFDLARDLTSRLRHQRDATKSSIDIGVCHFLSHFCLFDEIMPLFDSKGLTINLKEGPRHTLLLALEDGALDMVFTNNKDNLPTTTTPYRLNGGEVYALAHRKWKAQIKKFPEDLRLIPYFGYTANSPMKYETELFFSKNGFTPPMIGEADEVDLFQTVAERGDAFVLIPESATTRFLKSKNIISLGKIKNIQMPIWGVIKKNQRGPAYDFLTQREWD